MIRAFNKGMYICNFIKKLSTFKFKCLDVSVLHLTNSKKHFHFVLSNLTVGNFFDPKAKTKINICLKCIPILSRKLLGMVVSLHYALPYEREERNFT